MSKPGKLWSARFISLAVFAGLCTLAMWGMYRGSHSKSYVKIKTSEEQSVVLQRLTDAGVDANEINIRKYTPNPLSLFFVCFFFFGAALAVFLGIHSAVKSIVMRGSSNTSLHGSTESRASASSGAP